MKELLKFPRSVPQPPEVPKEVTMEVRAIWPEVVHALLDSGVVLLTVDAYVLYGFCSTIVLLRECRRMGTVATDAKVIAELRTIEAESLETACEYGESLMLPSGILGGFLK